MYVDARKDGCKACKLALWILKPFLAAASRSFGSSPEQLKQRFQDPYWRRGLVSVIKGIGLFGVTKPFVPGAPFQVVWNVTRACNLKCIHCYASAGSFDSDELSTSEAIKAIDVLADAGTLILAFSGGEPTIRPDILQLIRHAHDRGMYVAMATNAMVFSSLEKVREFKKNGLKFVQISLDGINPETHDGFRGVQGSFEKTVKGIKNCVAEDLFVEIATTATRYNYHEIPQLVDFAEKLNADWFMMYNFVPTGRGVEIVDSDLTPEEREELLMLLWDKMKTSRINVLSTAPQFAKVAQDVEAGLVKSMSISHISIVDESCDQMVVPTHFYNPTLAGDLKKLADFIGGCGAGRFYISMEPNGDLYPCVFFPRDEQMKLGNILEVDFEDMWKKSELLKKLRNKDILAPNCKTCEYRYTCGGCRARAYSYFGDVLAPDPGCTLNLEYWNKVKRQRQLLEAKR